MKRLLLTALLTLAPTVAMADCVVFLHGYARSPASFSVMEKVFQHKGFDTTKVGYPSKELEISELADIAVPEAVERCEGKAGNIHFVTHSLGGILVRDYFARQSIDRLGRIVMLAPPNDGSAIVDKLGKTKLFKKLSGPALLALTTGEQGKPGKLPAVKFELGVIAGKRSVNPVGSYLLEGPDDGAVTIESTKVDGMKDHIVLSATHTFMMNNPRVISQAAHFIQQGQFKR
ncbi:MAG: alpha/beta hydrolase [Hyphomicrobiales bacterium]